MFLQFVDLGLARHSIAFRPDVSPLVCAIGPG